MKLAVKKHFPNGTILTLERFTSTRAASHWLLQRQQMYKKYGYKIKPFKRSFRVVLNDKELKYCIGGAK